VACFFARDGLVRERGGEGGRSGPEVPLCEVVVFPLVPPGYDAGGGVGVAGGEVFAVGSALWMCQFVRVGEGRGCMKVGYREGWVCEVL
jgi:hypothetical protein